MGSAASLLRPCLIKTVSVASLFRPCLNKNEKKNPKISGLPKTHHEIHSRPETATNSRRRATKYLARGSSYSCASSIDPGFQNISLACILTYPHCCCCAACIRLGALLIVSCQRSLCFLYRDTRYICIFGVGVVRFVVDIELSATAWYQKTRRALLLARCLVLLLRERRCAVCGMTLTFHAMERKHKNDFVPIRTRRNPAAAKTRPHQKAFFYLFDTTQPAKLSFSHSYGRTHS